jgi:hypothetical protein
MVISSRIRESIFCLIKLIFLAGSFYSPPNMLSITVYERTFFGESKLGDIELSLASLTDERLGLYYFSCWSSLTLTSYSLIFTEL